MKTKDKNAIVVEFGYTGTSGHILVRRTMRGKPQEIIGHIFQEWNDETGTVIYGCYDMEGKETCPPSRRFTEAAVKFEKHIRQLAKAYPAEEEEKRVADFNGRAGEIRNVRRRKDGKNKETGIER